MVIYMGSRASLHIVSIKLLVVIIQPQKPPRHIPDDLKGNILEKY